MLLIINLKINISLNIDYNNYTEGKIRSILKNFILEIYENLLKNYKIFQVMLELFSVSGLKFSQIYV